MKYRPRIYYTETDKALMWNRWQKGESLNAIARQLNERPVKLWSSKRRQRDFTHVLRRPVEVTARRSRSMGRK